MLRGEVQNVQKLCIQIHTLLPCGKSSVTQSVNKSHGLYSKRDQYWRDGYIGYPALNNYNLANPHTTHATCSTSRSLYVNESRYTLRCEEYYLYTMEKRPGPNFIELLSRENCLPEILLSRFSWLPAKFACKINVLWLVVCFKMLSKNIC